MLCRTAVEFAAGGGKLSNLVVESQTGVDATSLLREFLGYKAELSAELDRIFRTEDQGAFDDKALMALILLIRMQVSLSTPGNIQLTDEACCRRYRALSMSWCHI